MMVVTKSLMQFRSVVSALATFFMAAAIQSASCRCEEPLEVQVIPSNPEFVRAAFETILKHHVEPPTRQQLVVDFIKYVEKSRNRPLTPELASTVSAMSDPDELYKFLQTRLDECDFYKAKNSGDILLGGLASAVSGSVDFVPRKEQLVAEQLAANRYVGIGIQVGNNMKISRVIEGGTAHAAGLMVDDIIESINGVKTENVAIAKSVDRLRGPEGTTAELVVRSPDGNTRELTVERRVVPMKSVEVMSDASIREDFVGLKILRITPSTVNELTKIIDNLPETNKAIVFDLSGATVDRTNIGFHSLHLLADALLDECELGEISSQAGSRKLRSEEGNILRGREFIFFYRPAADRYVDWLAVNLNSNGRLVYFEPDQIANVQVYRQLQVPGRISDDYNFRHEVGSEELFENGVGVFESIEIDPSFSLTIMTKWVTAKLPRDMRTFRGHEIVDFRRFIGKPLQPVKQ